LAILFRLSSTFQLIASTQRELGRAIHHLGERRAAEVGINSAFDRPGNAFASSSPDGRARADQSAATLGAFFANLLGATLQSLGKFFAGWSWGASGRVS
jgi:hypothetical protein